MGARPSRPKVYQKKVLKKNYEKLCQAAAKYIHDADVLVLCTGAGFSADSGLAVYIDIAKIPAYAERELEYYDLCKPHWLESDPDIFYGFWGQCFNDYKKTQPHEGYEIIANWKNQKNQPVEIKADNKPGRSYYKGSLAKRIEARLAKVDRNSYDTSGPYDVNGIAGAFYLFTSNVDAHSFDYFQAHEIRECHGNTELWQCGNGCTDEVWRAPTSNFEFQVNLTHMTAKSATTATTNIASTNEPPKQSTAAASAHKAREEDSTSVPKIGATLGTRRRHALRYMPPGKKQYPSAFKKPNRPICPKCKCLARPNILMFEDRHFVEDYAQDQRFNRWVDAVEAEFTSPPPPVAPSGDSPPSTCADTSDASADTDSDNEAMLPRVAIVEIGAGGNVTTVRLRSEGLLQRWSRCANCTLIRINPDLPLADKQMHNRSVISIMGKGLMSLRRIDHYKKIYSANPSWCTETDATLRAVWRELHGSDE